MKTTPSRDAESLERAAQYLKHSRARNTIVGLTWRDAEMALASHARTLRELAAKVRPRLVAP